MVNLRNITYKIQLQVIGQLLKCCQTKSFYEGDNDIMYLCLVFIGNIHILCQLSNIVQPYAYLAHIKAPFQDTAENKIQSIHIRHKLHKINLIKQHTNTISCKEWDVTMTPFWGVKILCKIDTKNGVSYSEPVVTSSG